MALAQDCNRQLARRSQAGNLAIHRWCTLTKAHEKTMVYVFIFITKGVCVCNGIRCMSLYGYNETKVLFDAVAGLGMFVPTCVYLPLVMAVSDVMICRIKLWSS